MVMKVFEKKAPANHILIKSSPAYYDKGDAVNYRGVLLGFADYRTMLGEPLSITTGRVYSVDTIDLSSAIVEGGYFYTADDPSLLRVVNLADGTDPLKFRVAGGDGSANTIWADANGQLYLGLRQPGFSYYATVKDMDEFDRAEIVFDNDGNRSI